MAIDKRGRKLPKGVRQTKSGFEGRFMFRGTSYSVSGQSAREAADKLSELKYRVTHGEDVRKDSITVESWARTWLDVYKRPAVRDSTFYHIEHIINKRAIPAIGKYRLADVRPEHIQQMLNDWAAEGFARQSLANYRASIREMLGQAAKNGLIDRNPADSTVLPRAAEPSQRVVLSHEERALFMEYAARSWLFNVFDLALRTGMRIGELTALRVADIDWRARVIHVRRTTAYAGHQNVEHETKTKSGMRDIPITPRIEQTIRAQLRRPVSSIDGRLFANVDGRPVTTGIVQAEIGRIVKAIRKDGHEMPDFTTHTFRHTFATHAVEAGMSLQDLKGILGHSSLAMTADLYAHVTIDAKRKAMDLTDAI